MRQICRSGSSRRTNDGTSSLCGLRDRPDLAINTHSLSDWSVTKLAVQLPSGNSKSLATTGRGTVYKSSRCSPRPHALLVLNTPAMGGGGAGHTCVSPTALFLASNISVIAYHPALYPHLKAQLTAERFKAFYAGVVKGKVTRFEVDEIGRAHV